MHKKIPPRLTQEGLVKKYFSKHPNKDIKHADIVPWLMEEWERRTKTKFRDPDRAIRKLFAHGFLKKIEKGIYRHDPQDIKNQSSNIFTEKQKKEILRMGDYQCAVCGETEKSGGELHIDHIKPASKGGKADIINGQILCSRHNFNKKNYKQTAMGKRMFINLEKRSTECKDFELRDFVRDVLKVYAKHRINGHIVWEKDDP